MLGMLTCKYISYYCATYFYLRRLRSLRARSQSTTLSATSTLPRSTFGARRPRSRRAATITGDPVEVASITCNLMFAPTATTTTTSGKAPNPFPDGSAYMMSNEQQRQVEQTLCSTKLLLHKLKRLLNEVS